MIIILVARSEVADMYMYMYTFGVYCTNDIINTYRGLRRESNIYG